MTAVRRDWIAGHGFVRLHFDLIDALGGSWEAAGLVDRIAFRAGKDGWWTATIADLGAELRLSEWKVKRAVQECRDAGMIRSERVSTFDPTLRWSVIYEGDSGAGNRPPVEEETSVTVEEESSVTPSSKNVRTTTPAEPSGGRGNLTLVEPSEPALFDAPDTPAPWPSEATENGCRQAWVTAWTETHGPPDPTLKRRALGTIKTLARDRGECLEAWRSLYRACREAGHAGRWNVADFLGPAPVSRYPQRTSNVYVGLANTAAATGLLDDMLDSITPRPAIGGHP